VVSTTTLPRDGGTIWPVTRCCETSSSTDSGAAVKTRRRSSSPCDRTSSGSTSRESKSRLASASSASTVRQSKIS